jgi:glycosyltransferase involved in cell wall biosynthesis
MTSSFPFVTICTPTFNRRPFIPSLIQCVRHQDYPKNRIEWVIIDDGTDLVEDLFINIEPQLCKEVKYFKYDKKMTLGKKRNLMHEKASGDILVYMDDDDYYPKERVSHSVELLVQNPSFLLAGSSRMYIYFKHISKMVAFGPYGQYHSTAACFAFRKELLLSDSRYNDGECLAEEPHFLKNYTVPMIQLDPLKTILVISHNHNSFDKKIMLENPSTKYVHDTPLTVQDFIKEPDLLQFFLIDVEPLLELYDPGRPIHKQDVIMQMEIKKLQRELHMKKALEDQITKMLTDQNMLLQQITEENKKLNEKNIYLETKLKLFFDNLRSQKKIEMPKNNL